MPGKTDSIINQSLLLKAEEFATITDMFTSTSFVIRVIMKELAHI